MTETDVSNVSNAIHTTSSICNDPIREEKKNCVKEDQESKIFSIHVYKKFKIRIYKPLIPLKLAFFIWYGGAVALLPFVNVFFKQRGMTLVELSTMQFITPGVQFLGPLICGIIADKIGRSKPVLVVNLLLTVLIVVAMVVAPNMNVVNCDPRPVNLICQHQEFGRLVAETSCDITMDVVLLDSCNVACNGNVTHRCQGQTVKCKMLESKEYFDNISLSVDSFSALKIKNKCFYNVTSMSHKNKTYTWCNVPHELYCNISCLINPKESCSAANSGRTRILILNVVIFILFATVVSNTYRFMDFTSMTLVREHNSDYGRERFFAISGQLVVSPLIGFLVDVTTTEGGDKNYNTAFYSFIGMIFLLLIVVYKLDVRIRPPGKNMWKKSFCLLKNADVIFFIIVLFILGTNFSFMRNFMFWYLAGMNPPSLLFGLINSAGALYGLPLLYTSNWWIKKIGCSQTFILALLGYFASGIGYSLLYDPWLSLLIEVANAVTYHLLWVAVIRHSHSLAPEGLVATVISTAGGIHFGLGRASGSLNGLIMNAYGGRVAFRVMAIISLVTAVFYAIFLYVRKVCYSGIRTSDITNGTGNITNGETDNTAKELCVI